MLEGEGGLRVDTSLGSKKSSAGDRKHVYTYRQCSLAQLDKLHVYMKILLSIYEKFIKRYYQMRLKCCVMEYLFTMRIYFEAKKAMKFQYCVCLYYIICVYSRLCELMYVITFSIDIEEGGRVPQLNVIMIVRRCSLSHSKHETSYLLRQLPTLHYDPSHISDPLIGLWTVSPRQVHRITS